MGNPHTRTILMQSFIVQAATEPGANPASSVSQPSDESSARGAGLHAGGVRGGGGGVPLAPGCEGRRRRKKRKCPGEKGFRANFCRETRRSSAASSRGDFTATPGADTSADATPRAHGQYHHHHHYDHHHHHHHYCD